MKIINKKHLQIDFLISKNLVAYEDAINFYGRKSKLYS